MGAARCHNVGAADQAIGGVQLRWQRSPSGWVTLFNRLKRLRRLTRHYQMTSPHTETSRRLQPPPGAATNRRRDACQKEDMKKKKEAKKKEDMKKKKEAKKKEDMKKKKEEKKKKK